MEIFSKKLMEIFKNVNEWLRFAEAKNAALLAFSSTGFAVNINLLSTSKTLPTSLRIGLVASTSFLCFCALACSISFLPKTNLNKITQAKFNPFKMRYSKSDNDNLFYFGHLRKYNPEELIEALNRLYFKNKIDDLYKKEFKDIASQIVVNSEIAYSKYRFFNYASLLLTLSLLSIAAAGLFHLILGQ